MDITWLGHSAFKLKTKTATILIDPFDPKIGLPWVPQKADILLMSHDHDDHHHQDGVEAGFVAEGPGEYEVNEVFMTGIRVFHDANKGADRGNNTAFAIQAEGLTVVHLGDLGHELSAEQAEELVSPDVLLIPVGGHYTIDGATAAKVVSQLEPRLVVPMHYQVDGLNLSNQLEGLEPFLKALGIEAQQPVSSLKVTKDALPDEMKVIILERST